MSSMERFGDLRREAHWRLLRTRRGKGDHRGRHIGELRLGAMVRSRAAAALSWHWTPPLESQVDHPLPPLGGA
ncbi:hypothetical protein GQ55_6G006800 [Panicum hallii var. hallii]|uniref:Uncharacterized protein n=1 Tax=Panicum hallii var. hallii TaxID=1504633 RepID=A0A2T7D2J1_9POAL|nr:hypothetical protein GQ55_6G006800 [Panicum hallii var. hallii]